MGINGDVINNRGINIANNNNSSNGNGNGLHIMMFPFLAFGHISPFLQLARKLSAVDPTARITILSAPANVPRISSLLPHSSSPSISLQSLPLPPVPGLPLGAESTADLTPSEAELLKIAVDAMKPDVQSLLSQLRPHLVIFDFAQPWIPSIAAPLGIKTLFFSVFAAVSTAYLTVPSRRPPGPTAPTMFLSDLLKKPPAGFPATSALAGGVPTYQAQSFTYIFKTFNDGKPCVYDRVVACLTGCSAIIAKTCKEMEGQYISYVESQYRKPLLLAGPVVPDLPSGHELEGKWAEWLNRFGPGSVVYCSFGSETLILKDEGVRELVLGLEMTGRPFVVVLNCCPESGDQEETMRKKLPEGFEERVKGRGVVQRGWVQQQLILRHESVGCFVCHAGFSSVVEGLLAGCQIVMMPQKGDQYGNSALFAGDLGIGVEVRREEGSGDFGREGVCEAVEMVMGSGEDHDHHKEEEIERRMVIKENHRKWRDFLMDRGAEERFMVEFVERLRALVKEDDDQVID